MTEVEGGGELKVLGKRGLGQRCKIGMGLKNVELKDFSFPGRIFDWGVTISHYELLHKS